MFVRKEELRAQMANADKHIEFMMRALLLQGNVKFFYRISPLYLRNALSMPRRCSLYKF